MFPRALNLLDRVEDEESEGLVTNSATIRCVLALRNIVMSNGPEPAQTFTQNLRVIVQLSTECKFLDASSFLTPSGSSVLFPQDISKFINSVSRQDTLRFVWSSVSLLLFLSSLVACRLAHVLLHGSAGPLEHHLRIHGIPGPHYPHKGRP